MISPSRHFDAFKSLLEKMFLFSKFSYWTINYVKILESFHQDYNFDYISGVTD